MSNFKYELKGDKCYLVIGGNRLKIRWSKRWIGEGSEIIQWATKVELDKESSTLKVGETLQLKATLTPSGASDTLVWSSSNDKKATVSDKGLVTAVAEGSATITVKSSQDASIKATCSITVEAAQQPDPEVGQ